MFFKAPYGGPMVSFAKVPDSGSSPLWLVGLLFAGFLAESCAGGAGEDAMGPGSGGAAPGVGGIVEGSGGVGASSGGGSSSGGTSSSTGGTGGATGEGSGGASTGGAASGGGSSGGSGGGTSGSCKRGVAYGHHSVADLTALSPGISFWYNWDFRPDAALRGGAYRELGIEYIPMIWGGGTDVSAARRDIPEQAQVLLGYNEPNFGSQANMSAAEAALRWPELEELAEARGLKLVSPAVNFCGGDCQDTDPFHYLDEFFERCEGCRVDAIAIHIYVGCSPPGDNKAEWLIGHVENYKSRYSLPLWLTEFACDNATSLDEQEAFLRDAVQYLEAEPRIERYAWFAGRADNVPFVDLLGADGELTSLGEAYVSAPKNPECEH